MKPNPKVAQVVDPVEEGSSVTILVVTVIIVEEAEVEEADTAMTRTAGEAELEVEEVEVTVMRTIEEIEVDMMADIVAEGGAIESIPRSYLT